MAMPYHPPDPDDPQSNMTFTNCLPNFQPHQILCLPDQADRLYVEVIQVIATRQMCWVRPLVLVTASLTSEQRAVDEPIEPSFTLHDLRQSSDLLWSALCFRVALDIEVIPVLANLGDIKLQSESDRLARKQLQDFMQRVWQAQSDQCCQS